jgi:hypothetical protein
MSAYRVQVDDWIEEGGVAVAEVKFYRNKMTGIKSQPHRLGKTDDGHGIYMALEGWEPLDADENPIEVQADEEGRWII